MHIIDRRLNPKGKSLVNRQRFIRRARSQIKKAIEDGLRTGKISDIDSQGRITIKGGDRLAEPAFRPDSRKGKRSTVWPGNKDFIRGDEVRKPPSGQGQGSKASDSGEGEDAFQFSLTRDEFLEFFFEDLELPDLVKRSLKAEKTYEMRRAGFRRFGTPSALDLKRTMRNSLARRISLQRPSGSRLAELEDEIDRLKALEERSPEQETQLIRLTSSIRKASIKMQRIPYLDPLDVRYRNFEPVEKPVSQAVMFCLMDVSGSMSEHHKDLAKRFFLLLHLFLERQYERVELVFIRHTTQASEVDEETFFYSRESGGTIVSSALREMIAVISDRYPLAEWNIYAAQASDGENFDSDNGNCLEALSEHILPVCQYFAYVEVGEESDRQLFGTSKDGSALWRTYGQIQGFDQRFSMRKISDPADIYPVFRDLFARRSEAA
ncbi:YeaH/YhbH family protein [Coralliovum pocilloporae]|uniref:YeaH/YhbH family protein n=1 Tax=Coralliovum pocilloporae TaxID=3066369 RepID=UPI003307B5BE